MVLTEFNRSVWSQIRASIAIEIAHEGWLEDIDDEHENPFNHYTGSTLPFHPALADNQR